MSKTKDQQQPEPDVGAIHPELERHGSFEHMKLGRPAPRHDERTLRLAKYLDDAVLLPEIPATFDLTPAVASWPMYGNDSLGDCTIAAVGHMIQAWSAATGNAVTPEEAAIIAAYWATGSTDTGRFEVDVLNYWRNVGVGGDKILAYAYVDAKNLEHVRAALYLFGGLYTGIALPKSAQTQAVWDVVGDAQTGDSQPGSWGGHAVPYLPRWDGARIPLVTWGHVLDATLPFHLAYCDELYAVISPDFLKDGKTPAGFDLAALEADLAEIGTPQNAAAVEGEAHVPGAQGEPEPVQAAAEEFAAAATAESQARLDEEPTGGDDVAHDTDVDAEELRAEVDGQDDGYYWKG